MPPMMSFLQGNLALVLGILGFFATVAARLAARDEVFRRDIGGAVVWFGVFLALRLNGFWLEDVVPDGWPVYVRVAWMLSFAYGAIRAAVASLLWVGRRFSPEPTAKIHRDVADFVLYLLASVPILKTQLKLDVTTLLGTSAVLSLVLGFALQDTLGNLFSGLSLQFERPWKVGDHILVDGREGQVVQVSWRSMRIETPRGEVVTLPNALVAKEDVVNFTNGGRPVGIDVVVGAAYEAPPNLVKAEVLEALREAPLVLDAPAPLCRLKDFGDSAVNYQVRFYVADYARAPAATDEVLSRLWYRFGRAGISIPFPQRVVTMRKEPEATTAPHEQVLAQLDVFAPFEPAERAAIARSAVERRFGGGESVVVEGREGETFYAVVSGTLSVQVGKPAREVARLTRGQGFGEMSLLTGEKRSATVVAQEDCVLLEIDRTAFFQFFAEHPERAQAHAGLLARRRAELEAATAPGAASGERDAGHILERLRRVFRLRG